MERSKQAHEPACALPAAQATAGCTIKKANPRRVLLMERISLRFRCPALIKRVNFSRGVQCISQTSGPAASHSATVKCEQQQSRGLSTAAEWGRGVLRQNTSTGHTPRK